jgi:hypothetical protein
MFQHDWPTALARFERGEIQEFGPVSVSLGGIKSEEGSLPWPRVKEVRIKDEGLVITQRGAFLEIWAKVSPIAAIPNFHVLMALIRTGQRLRKRKAEG